MGILGKIKKKTASLGSKKDQKFEKEKEKETAKGKKTAVAPEAKGKKAERKAVRTDAPAAAKTTDQKPAEEAGAGTQAREGSALSSRVLISPVTTEKSERAQSVGKYTFLVSPDANKHQVARAVQDLYGVSPVAVRIMVRRGKSVRFGRVSGRRKSTKRAIVTLKAGDSISFLEG